MATNNPKSRLTEGTLNSPPYASPNGVTERRPGNAGATTPGTTPAEGEMGRRADETPGEKDRPVLPPGDGSALRARRGRMATRERPGPARPGHRGALPHG